VTQKSVNPNVNPVVSVIVTYVVALIATLIIYPFYPSSLGFMASLNSLNWASYTLGLTIIGVEFGYLLAYRAGWHLNLTAITTTILVTLLLVPLGMIVFHEEITARKIIGVLLGIVGLFLINTK
jgi:drug/metabolite transporter (DMT)-like permease